MEGSSRTSPPNTPNWLDCSPDSVWDGQLHQHLHARAAAWTNASSVDDGAGLLVAAERGDPAEVVHRRWRTSAEALRAALAARDPHDRVIWVAGELAVRTLATTRLSECWIHTRDIAAGVGVELPVPDRIHHIARLAWRTLPYAFAQGNRAMAGAGQRARRQRGTGRGLGRALRCPRPRRSVSGPRRRTGGRVAVRFTLVDEGRDGTVVAAGAAAFRRS